MGLFISRKMDVTSKEERTMKCSLSHLPANYVIVCNKNTLCINLIEPVGIIGILRTGNGCLPLQNGCHRGDVADHSIAALRGMVHLKNVGNPQAKPSLMMEAFVSRCVIPAERKIMPLRLLLLQ